jgi:thiol-disulfide isomerase/thioredoxin
MYASDPALVRNTGRPQVVEFFAFWCDVCHAMHPTMVTLQQQYQQQVDFIYLDIDADNTKALRQSMGFTGLRPTIVFIAADGTEMGRLVGMHNLKELTDQISTILAVG